MTHEFKHEKTFRFEVLNTSQSPRKVLYVLHGYGQLVKYFIRKFSKVPDDILIVAPEGMHRFYLKGSHGRVGASWMTKEARETDIADTISYLNKVDELISNQYPTIETRYLLGFSQGGATAARWAQLGKTSFDALILWASVFPPDLPQLNAPLPIPHRFFALGDQDQFFTPEDQQATFQQYKEMDFQLVPFKGDHDIINETLTEILRQIERN